MATSGTGGPDTSPSLTISVVGEDDLKDLLPLMRSYCEFYGEGQEEDALLALARALIANRQQEGTQLLARLDGNAAGFASVFWSWSTVSAARIGVMNDLYVALEARGKGVAERLIAGCRELCCARGAVKLQWQTKPDNFRAQRVYERVGGVRDDWLNYWLPTR